MDYLFGFFQGEVISWELETGPGTDDTINDGYRTQEIKTWYKVETDIQTYLFFLLDYTRDDKHPDNVGLYSLRVIKAEDKDTQFTYWQDMIIPGIYNPNE